MRTQYYTKDMMEMHSIDISTYEFTVHPIHHLKHHF